MMLLAPKTLWAMVNFSGWVGGKYGAKTHFSPHRRRRILQAAHGLRTTAGGEGGRDGEDWEDKWNFGEDWEGEEKLGEDWGAERELGDGELENGVGIAIGFGVAALPLNSIFSDNGQLGERERERDEEREL